MSYVSPLISEGLYYKALTTEVSYGLRVEYFRTIFLCGFGDECGQGCCQ